MDRVVSPSPLRVEPSCKHTESCGGCPWQHLGYPSQAEFKAAEVEEQLVALYSLSDVSSEALAQEEVEGLSLDVDILKVPHHGSDTSSSQIFLDAVTPDMALISVGIKNTFGHPSRRVLKRLERIDSAVYRTDTGGRLTVTTDGKKIEVLDNPVLVR